MSNIFYKIEQDLKEGRKKKACDRLRNLINQSPDDISLRKSLGNIYYEAGFLDEAGKFWILCEPENDTMKMAVEVYRKSLSSSGNAILKDIVFRGDKNLLDDYAKNVISGLEENSFKLTKQIPEFKRKAIVKEIPTSEINFFTKAGIFLLIGLVILLPVLGIVKIFEILNSFFSH
ncbi:hypothetical protein H3Z85_11860 [Chryseobacterium indologenes]|uniref:DUF6584 family protein n=1 Tax=Chryseobacterium indologenes TaxID=253 RepID=UPI0003E074A0|nr:DUF6584 family protein [Chryseobacterium indologenes]QPQ50231.1 hypothetical protein H3Z85_11860 [Chryseobacterium indologenes]GAE66048.1 hypothetical protein CIN01S_13_01380 [Chryseobacterium indologenes NBRC 14944]SFK33695.1 hypothetical protein SAMN05421692_4070 [Chryseobacterium indologenes]SUX52828.1 Uncharacterised protein [Chryseobacterium indologenes]